MYSASIGINLTNWNRIDPVNGMGSLPSNSLGLEYLVGKYFVLSVNGLWGNNDNSIDLLSIDQSDSELLKQLSSLIDHKYHSG